MKDQTRRNFIKNTSLGVATVGFTSLTQDERSDKKTGSQKPREVWIASLTQNEIEGVDMNESIQSALQKMEKVAFYCPDIICLPEVFHIAGVKEGRPSLTVSSEDGSGNITKPFQAFAKTHNCYVVCPIFTVDNGKYYNAAVVIDRQGKILGEYRKIRLTKGEMDIGLTPGPLDPPVFKLDFGVIGIQICYDIFWPEGWHFLSNKGVEIVFWPSAFCGGKRLNAKALENNYIVVSSTRSNIAKICDITGEDMSVSGTWSKWGVFASVNLEKITLSPWPESTLFPEIQKKYGRKVKIYSLHEENLCVIESLSADLKVSDILKEFKIKSTNDKLQLDEDRQKKLR